MPTDLIIKQQKPDWEAEFDNEIRMYQRLAPLQGSVVPVLYGTVAFEGVRALLLSDLGGRQIASVGYDVVSRDTLRNMLIASLRPIYDLGICPYDANLLNFHLVDGNKIMIVDHEQDDDLEEGDEEELDELVEGKAESIMDIHWQVHKPRSRRGIRWRRGRRGRRHRLGTGPRYASGQRCREGNGLGRTTLSVHRYLYGSKVVGMRDRGYVHILYVELLSISRKFKGSRIVSYIRRCL